MKLKDYTTKEIKQKLNARSDYLTDNYMYCHKDKTYKALLNEYSRRVLGYVI